jgi:hypothetical protein
LEDTIDALETIARLLKEVVDENSSRVRAAQLQQLYARNLAAIERLGQAETYATAAELQDWRRDSAALRERRTAAVAAIAAEMRRLKSTPGIPTSFNDALAREAADMQRTSQKYVARTSAAASSTPNHTPAWGEPGSIFDAEGRLNVNFNDGTELTIRFENEPDSGSARLVGHIVELARKHTSNFRGRRISLRNGVTELTLLGIDDIPALAQAIDVGDVTQADPVARSLTIVIDEARLSKAIAPVRRDAEFYRLQLAKLNSGDEMAVASAFEALSEIEPSDIADARTRGQLAEAMLDAVARETHLLAYSKQAVPMLVQWAGEDSIPVSISLLQSGEATGHSAAILDALITLKDERVIEPILYSLLHQPEDVKEKGFAYLATYGSAAEEVALGLVPGANITGMHTLIGALGFIGGEKSLALLEGLRNDPNADFLKWEIDAAEKRIRERLERTVR